MRIAAGILILFALTVEASGQAPAPSAPPTAGIRTLTILADDLPQADREHVIRSLDRLAYSRDEFEERVRLSLRNLGYAYARVDQAELSGIRQGKEGASADVSVKVEPGAQYRLGTIQFHRATLFPPDQLRNQFPIQTGSLFCATNIQYGLERLRRLYEDKGYINFGAIPKIEADEAHHIVNLVLDVDEGKPYVFGHLLLDGVEPRASAGQELIESWASLQGKPYNPDLLRTWLTTNWPAGVNDPQHTVAIENESREVNFRLQFP
jgi:outer membrane translocation and assembly module TamA